MVLSHAAKQWIINSILKEQAERKRNGENISVKDTVSKFKKAVAAEEKKMVASKRKTKTTNPPHHPAYYRHDWKNVYFEKPVTKKPTQKKPAEVKEPKEKTETPLYTPDPQIMIKNLEKQLAHVIRNDLKKEGEIKKLTREISVLTERLKIITNQLNDPDIQSVIEQKRKSKTLTENPDFLEI